MNLWGKADQLYQRNEANTTNLGSKVDHLSPHRRRFAMISSTRRAPLLGEIVAMLAHLGWMLRINQSIGEMTTVRIAQSSTQMTVRELVGSTIVIMGSCEAQNYVIQPNTT
jgi:hypothetical protein